MEVCKPDFPLFTSNTGNETDSQLLCHIDCISDNYEYDSGYDSDGSRAQIESRLLGSDTQPDVIYDASSGFDRYTNYAPILVDADLRICSDSSRFHPINQLGSQLVIPGWDHELRQENDSNLRDYIGFGVKNGFLIVDDTATIPTYECPNYASCLKGDAHDYIDNLIAQELAEGKLILADVKPHCVHGLGAVPKKGGKWRPITDCRPPLGQSINCFMSSTFREFTYTTVDQVVEMITPGCYMASVDIAAAYRSILVHPSQWKFQGLSWCFAGEQRYIFDTRICFGLRCAPYIFTQVSNFVLRCLKRRGHLNCLVYLDDYLVVGDSEYECANAQNVLISILRSLGFDIAWDKCVGPTQVLTYLGVQFNSNEMSVSIQREKMEKLQAELRFFEGKRRATVHQIQRLCGVLAHCSKVIKGGRTFSRRIIDHLKGLPPGNKRIRLDGEFLHDLSWWREFSKVFNGKNLMTKYNFGQGPWFCTDSCMGGYGLWHGSDWQSGYFNVSNSPDLTGLDPTHVHWMNIHVGDDSSNINVLELIPVWLGVRRFAEIWGDYHVVCFTDNANVMTMVNKGVSSNSTCMCIIRDIFWICALHNIHLTARHIAGSHNVLADILSRIIFTNDLSVTGDFHLCCSVNRTSGYGKDRHPHESRNTVGVG